MNRLVAFLVISLLTFNACKQQEVLNDPAARGARSFVGLGCSKCHKIGDIGNEWGPNLTLIGFRKSPEWLDLWLKNPHSWNMKSVMPNFNLNDKNRADLVAYLSSQKGQAWKVAPWRTDEAKALPAHARGQLIFNQAGCVACHGQNGGGGYPNNNVVGGLIPALTLVADGYSKQELHDKIKNGVFSIPKDMSAPKPMVYMPKWGDQLKSDEIDAVVEYLFSLKPKPLPGSKAAKDDF